MQDAQDLDALGNQYIEDYVPTFMVLAVTGTNAIAGTAHRRSLGERAEAVVELGQVLVLR
jgi:hypothetical protein